MSYDRYGKPVVHTSSPRSTLSSAYTTNSTASKAYTQAYREPAIYSPYSSSSRSSRDYYIASPMPKLSSASTGRGYGSSPSANSSSSSSYGQGGATSYVVRTPSAGTNNPNGYSAIERTGPSGQSVVVHNTGGKTYDPRRK